MVSALILMVSGSELMRRTIETKLGKHVTVVAVADSLVLKDVNLLLPDIPKIDRETVMVAMLPFPPRVRRKGKGVGTPADIEREEREKGKRLTKVLKNKKTPYNRRIGWK